MTMNNEQLRHLIAGVPTDIGRTTLSGQPWAAFDGTLATTGYLLVWAAVPVDGAVPFEAARAGTLDHMRRLLHGPSGDPVRVPLARLREWCGAHVAKELCTDCEGKPDLPCRKCDGRGTTECPHCEQDMDCEECDGKRVCGRCNATGQVAAHTKRPGTHGGAWFDLNGLSAAVERLVGEEDVMVSHHKTGGPPGALDVLRVTGGGWIVVMAGLSDPKRGQEPWAGPALITTDGDGTSQRDGGAA